MAIHTSAIFYRRGVPNTANNFAFVAQSNNTIPVPLNLYLRNFNFYNRKVSNQINGRQRWPWSK
jgi:hypothetical protein